MMYKQNPRYPIHASDDVFRRAFCDIGKQANVWPKLDLIAYMQSQNLLQDLWSDSTIMKYRIHWMYEGILICSQSRGDECLKSLPFYYNFPLNLVCTKSLRASPGSGSRILPMTRKKPSIIPEMFVIDILIIVVMVLSVCVQLHLARCSQHVKLGLQ